MRRSQVRHLMWSAYVRPKGRLGNRLQGYVIGSMETRRVRREWDRADRILLVHTPGKVGSMAMVAALDACKLPGDTIFHTHRVNPKNLVGLHHERETLAPRRTWYTTDFLGAELRKAHGKEVVVLAAVRDPVERALSAFLQNAERYVESGRPIAAMSRMSMNDLTDAFVRHLDHRSITRWMDLELNQMFGVDVFANQFDHSAGFQVEVKDDVVVGILRHDRFSDALIPFIRGLTGLSPPVVGRVNDSSAKPYGDVHQMMRQSMRLPKSLLEEVYSTRYARHFFSERERDAAVHRWLAVPPLRDEKCLLPSDGLHHGRDLDELDGARVKRGVILP